MGCSEDDAPTTSTTDYTEFLDELEQEIPPCYHDCGITSPTSLCTLILDDTDTCMDDCTGDDQPDEEFIEMCAVCIAADNCDEEFIGDDDDSDGDDGGDDDDSDGDDGGDDDDSDDDDSDGDDGGDDDDSDDDDSECLLDCPLSMFMSSTGMCEFVGAGDSSCLNDCSEENAMFFEIMPIFCGTCVADGNCDEVISDGDDGDGTDYDGPPECFDDCDYEPTDNSTGTEICEFIGGDISCTEDCIGDDAIPEEIIGICAACLAAGNCDEIFDDDGE